MSWVAWNWECGTKRRAADAAADPIEGRPVGAVDRGHSLGECGLSGDQGGVSAATDYDLGDVLGRVRQAIR